MPPGRALTRAEDRLLTDLAAQVGLALHNARLTAELEARLALLATQAAELEASAKRLIQVQDQERQRLERAIRQGPNRRLASIAGKLRLAEQAVGRDPAATAALLDALDREAELTGDTLRDLARGLFPSLLADKGLLAALSALVRKTAAAAVVEATPAAATRWPPQVEAAAYFCCQEALDNAARHARGAPASVRLDVRSGWLEFSVTDMGPGFDPAGVDGTGLQHMTDRVEALAGTLQVLSTPALGIRVVGRIPLQTTTEAVTTSPGSLPPR